MTLKCAGQSTQTRKRNHRWWRAGRSRATSVNKKKLIGVCRSCGKTTEMDTIHKAGKQLHKDIPTYYAANPEFSAAGRPGVGASERNMKDAADQAAAGKGKKGKKNKRE